jgi:hypothetical protein
MAIAVGQGLAINTNWPLEAVYVPEPVKAFTAPARVMLVAVAPEPRRKKKVSPVGIVSVVSVVSLALHHP